MEGQAFTCHNDMTPEAKFKGQLKKRWDKWHKHSKTADWTSIPGVKGIPDVHISVPGSHSFMEVKVLPNGLNKNQQVTIPRLSYGTPVMVIAKQAHPTDWKQDRVLITRWRQGKPYPMLGPFTWEDISREHFWEDLLDDSI